MLSLVEGAPTLPLSDCKLIRSRDLQNLIEQSVAELPEELAEARQLVSHEEQILSTARRQAQEMMARAEEEARQMITAAQEQVSQMISESEVVKSIHIEAERVREQVRMEAQRIYQITEQEIRVAEEESKHRIRLVLDSALIEAENIRRGANSYAEAVLHELERTTLGAISIIQNGQRQLDQVSKQNTREEHFNKFKVALSDVKNLPADLLTDPRLMVPQQHSQREQQNYAPPAA